MKRSNVVLTGFMGTGKTTVGRLLARQLGYDFVDTDELIRERSGRTVPEIFKDLGEAAFRAMEAAVALELSQKPGLVIATGGRMLLDPENAVALGSTGRVFCLAATPEEILERVSKDQGTRRPLLEGPDPMGRIIDLLRRRQEGYGRFPTLITSGKSPDAIAGELLGILQTDPTFTRTGA